MNAGRLGGRQSARWARPAAMVLELALAACGRAEPDAGPAAAPAEWSARAVHGIPVGADLTDVVVTQGLTLVAVGTVPGDDQYDRRLAIWRSTDGFGWTETFRRMDPLGTGDTSGMPSDPAVAAFPGGLAVVASDCDQRCVPLAFSSETGEAWSEAAIAGTSANTDQAAPRSAGGHVGGTLGPGRQVRGTPDYTVFGAQMRDVVFTGQRLVAVGWEEAEGPGYNTSRAVWLSDDRGRTWTRPEAGAVPVQLDFRDDLVAVVVAGDRVVAVASNRYSYDGSNEQVLVAGLDGEHWTAVPFPDDKSVRPDGLAALGGAAHVFGQADYWTNAPTDGQWRLAPDDQWTQLPAGPGGHLVGTGDELVTLTVEPDTDTEQHQLVLYRSTDGRELRRDRASARHPGLGLDAVAVGNGRLLAYVHQDGKRLVYEARV